MPAGSTGGPAGAEVTPAFLILRVVAADWFAAGGRRPPPARRRVTLRTQILPGPAGTGYMVLSADPNSVYLALAQVADWRVVATICASMLAGIIILRAFDLLRDRRGRAARPGSATAPSVRKRPSGQKKRPPKKDPKDRGKGRRKGKGK